MLEDVEASASVAQCRETKQRRKKRGRLHYSIPKELSKSRMRRNNVVLCFNVDHGDTSRTLDFQRTNNLVLIELTVCGQSSRKKRRQWPEMMLMLTRIVLIK
jgi:hypothetical protein